MDAVGVDISGLYGGLAAKSISWIQWSAAAS